ncbi:hypothetical protein BOX15_Mlig014364g1 [Macrostomum lignano]|uniref:Calmodulin n=2 Tax=Macrostomum lignano TaxID=282301 RepID=A0A1I8I5D7_9PLAT|nr:hypothetical protein BOX15_Mlig014364g1 [Macrostomum lignano]
MSTAEQLSEEELALYKAAFGIFDRDSDGSITAAELGSVMRSLGRHPSDAEIKEMINEVDEDGNGSVDLSEFLTLMLRKTSDADAEEEIRETFRVFDRDEDGYLSVKELRHVMSCLGEEVSEVEAVEMLLTAKIKNGGESGSGSNSEELLVSFDEFRALATGQNWS